MLILRTSLRILTNQDRSLRPLNHMKVHLYSTARTLFPLPDPITYTFSSPMTSAIQDLVVNGYVAILLFIS